jgi:hypothetical protein
VIEGCGERTETVLRRMREPWMARCPAGLLGANPLLAAVPKIEPNRSIPGVGALTQLAGGLSTLVVVGAAIGFMLGLGLMAIAGSAQNVHLRERAKSGTGWALAVAVLAAGANRLLDWAWGIGTGL